jgi:ABC-type sugar transport system ATPase subunit
MRKVPGDEIRAQVLHAAELLSIPHILDQYPATLSGGERQRAALARAMVLKPRRLLLDEPFSALDPTTKAQMYEEMERIHCAFGCTMLFVTHDFQEATRLADRIGILLDGQLLVVTSPDQLFQGGYDPKVDEFLGLQRRRSYDGAGAVPDAARKTV